MSPIFIEQYTATSLPGCGRSHEQNTFKGIPTIVTAYTKPSYHTSHLEAHYIKVCTNRDFVLFSIVLLLTVHKLISLLLPLYGFMDREELYRLLRSVSYFHMTLDTVSPWQQTKMFSFNYEPSTTTRTNNLVHTMANRMNLFSLNILLWWAQQVEVFK